MALFDPPALDIQFNQGEHLAIPSAASDARPDAPLAKVLTAEGRLDLPAGFSGNLDASGWKLVSQGNEPPRFLQSIPGDEKWAPGSGPNGVNGFIEAIAVDGNGNVYWGERQRFRPRGRRHGQPVCRREFSHDLPIGGYRTSAGGIPMNHLTIWSPDIQTWLTFWSGGDGAVYALAVDPATGTVIVGGGFYHTCEIGATPPNCGTKTPVRHVAVAIGLSYWGGLTTARRGT